MTADPATNTTLQPDIPAGAAQIKMGTGVGRRVKVWSFPRPDSGGGLIGWDANQEPSVIPFSDPGGALAVAVQLGSLSTDQLTQLANLITALTNMPNPILITQYRAADGTLAAPVELTLIPGQMLTTDANGNITQSPVPVIPAERAGDLVTPSPNVVGGTGTVTFSSVMPSANYLLEIFNNQFAGAVSISNRTASGFTFTLLSVLGGTFSYHAMQKI